jgi:hypothetical protein
MKHLAVALIALSLAVSAQAETAKSTFTKIDLKKCKQIEKPDGFVFEGSWTCKGLKGFDVVYSGMDLRATMAFGPKPKTQCSASQTFGHFNSPGDTIEWRLAKGKPYATILRWFTDNGEPDGKQNWLVVTKIDGDEVCRTTIVDTQFPNANQVARRKADQSTSFNCAKDVPELVSTKPLKADEIMSGVPCSQP